MKYLMVILLALEFPTYMSGDEWVQISTIDKGMVAFSVDHLDSKNWILATHGYILRTTDGGRSWIDVAPSFDWGQRIFDIQFVDDTLAVAGYNTVGGIFVSPNKGANWTISRPPDANVFRLSVPSKSVGGLLEESSQLWLTYEGLDQWEEVAVPADSAGASVSYSLDLDTSGVVALGAYGGHISVSRDSGNTWSVQRVGKDIWTDIEIITEDLWVATSAVAGLETPDTSHIAVTIDSGRSWNFTHTEPGTFLSDIEFLKSGIGYAVGSDSTILKSTDFGASWSRQTSPVNVWYNSVTVISDGHAVAVGGEVIVETNSDSAVSVRTVSKRLNPHLQLFPQPAVDRLTVIIDNWISPLEVRFIDILGRSVVAEFEIHFGNGRTELRVDVSQLARGYSQLAIHHKEGVITAAFIKQ